MMQLAIGVAGKLQVKYQTAATLGNWSLSINDEHLAGGPPEWTVDAVIKEGVDFFLAAFERFTLSLEVGKHVWRWDDVHASVGNGTAHLSGTGRPEITT